MNLRRKTNRPELNTIARTAFCALCIFSASRAVAGGSNKVSLPVALSFPVSSEGVERSVMRFGNDRFQEGFDISQNLQDVSITDPFPFKMSGVNLKGHIKGRIDRDVKGLIVEANLQHLAISIDRISIHSVVKARTSGVDASIRIDAECTNSVIRWPMEVIPFFVRGRLTTAPKLALAMSGLALPVDVARPDMKLDCSGPFGIEDLIRDYAWTAIQTRWTDPAFAEEIERKVEDSFSSALAVGGSGMNIVNQPDLVATVLPEKYTADKDGAYLRASLQLEFDRPMPTLIASVLPVELPPGKIDEVTLSISTVSVQSVFQAFFAPGVWSEWIEGKTIDSFTELMSSRFKQIIAFPDLQNYPKDAPFWFELEMATNPALQCDGGKLAMNLPVVSRMLLKDTNREIGYKALVGFQIPTRISLTLPQNRSRRTTSASVDSLDFSYEFDSRYVETERPNTIIAAEQIRGGIDDFVESKIADLTKIEGVVGEIAKGLNRTNVNCESSNQMLQIVLPAN